MTPCHPIVRPFCWDLAAVRGSGRLRRITSHSSLCGQSGGYRGRGLVLELAQNSRAKGRKDVGEGCTIYRALLLRLRLCDSVTVVVADGLWWGYLR
jgi:hypothetical protein